MAKAAGKARVRGAARAMAKAGGALPKIGGRSIAGPPVAQIRRWIQCGWDAEYYDNEVALAVPGEVIECVVQDTTGAVRGCMMAEVLAAPSQWEEGVAMPVRFLACEDHSIAEWAAASFLQGGAEVFLPKQIEVDNERLAVAGVVQCS